MAPDQIFVHDIAFTPDILRAFPDMIVSSVIGGVNFKTNSALFAIFCPAFRDLITADKGFLDHDDLTVIVDSLSAKDIQFLDRFLHEGNIKVELEDYDEMKQMSQTLYFLFSSPIAGESALSNVTLESQEPENTESTQQDCSHLDQFSNVSEVLEEGENEAIEQYISNLDSKCDEKHQQNEDTPMEDLSPPLPDVISNRKSTAKVKKPTNVKTGWYKGVGRPRKTDRKKPPRRKREPGEEPSKIVKKEHERLLEYSEMIRPKTMCFKDIGKYGLRGLRKARPLYDGEVNFSDVDENDLEPEVNISVEEENPKVEEEINGSGDQISKDKEDQEEISKPKEKKEKISKPKKKLESWVPDKEKVKRVYDHWDKQVAEMMLVHETSDKTVATFEVQRGSASEFETHTKTFLKSESRMNANNCFVCPKCGDTCTFDNWDYFLHHQIEGHYFTTFKLACGLCPKYFEDREERFKHWIDHFPTFISGVYTDEFIFCRICGKEFITVRNLRRFRGKKFADHIKMHETCTTGCIACGFRPLDTNRKEEKDIRQTKKHDRLRKLYDRMKKHEEEKGPHHDSFCAYSNCHGVEFSSWEEHVNHVNLMHGGCFKYKCGFCEQIFDNESLLEFHHFQVHKKEKEISTKSICHQCGMRVTDIKKHLSSHDLENTSSIEEDPGVFICDACGKSFKSASSLKTHDYKVHRNRAKYPCNDCGKLFYKSHLRTHIISVHTPDSQKPLKCVVCGKGFASEKRLKIHNSIHENKRAYQCTFCGQGFNDNANRRAHEKKNCSKRT